MIYLDYIKGSGQVEVRSCLYRCQWCPPEYRFSITPPSQQNTGSHTQRSWLGLLALGFVAADIGSLPTVELLHWVDLGTCISHNSDEWSALTGSRDENPLSLRPYDLGELGSVAERYEEGVAINKSSLGVGVLRRFYSGSDHLEMRRSTKDSFMPRMYS